MFDILFRTWYIIDMGYMTPDEFGKKLFPPISGRRVRVLCKDNRIKGAERVGRSWMIPDDAKIDNRDNRRKK